MALLIITLAKVSCAQTLFMKHSVTCIYWNQFSGRVSTFNSWQTISITQNLLAYIVSGSFLVFLTIFLFLFLLMALHCSKRSRMKLSNVYEHRITSRDNIYSVDPTVHPSLPSYNPSQDDAHHSSSSPFASLTTEVSNITASNFNNAFNCLEENVYMEIP